MRESRRIFRFAVIGTLNALIIAAVIWLMMDELDIDYMLSNITAYVIAQTHNFIWCKHWIFPLDDKEKKSNLEAGVALFYRFRNGISGAISISGSVGRGTEL